jgi:hypothetical protein
MIRQAYTMMTAALLTLAPATGAQGFDALRCEAIGMRKEGQWYECLGRCERRIERRAERLGGAADGRLADCRQACEDRLAEALDQLDQRDICSAAAPDPDPNRCQARLLRTGATRLICKAQCASHPIAMPGGDCESECNARCASAVDRLMAKDICHGHAGSDLCADHPIAQ